MHVSSFIFHSVFFVSYMHIHLQYNKQSTMIDKLLLRLREGGSCIMTLSMTLTSL